MNSLKLKIKWSKREKDFVVYYPRKSDGGWILHYIVGKRKETLLSDSAKDQKFWTKICGVDWNKHIGLFEVDFISELVDRGFDKTTLKFEVMIDLAKLKDEFSHILESMSPTEKKQLQKILNKKGIKS